MPPARPRRPACRPLYLPRAADAPGASSLLVIAALKQAQPLLEIKVGTAPQAKAKVEGGLEAYAERLRQEKIQLYEDRLAKGGFLPYVAGGGAVAPTSRRSSRPGAIWSARATGAAPISSLSSPSSSHRPR
jgi:hypothetical protein